MVKSFHEQAVNHSRLCMGIDVPPTPLEIKAILTGWQKTGSGQKPWLQLKIGLDSCKIEWYFGQVGLGLAMTLVFRRLGALWVVRWYPDQIAFQWRRLVQVL